MKSVRIFGLRPVVFLLLLCAGGVLGSLAYWPDAEEPPAATPAAARPTDADRSPAAAPARGNGTRSARTPTRDTTDRPAPVEPETGHVFAASGLRFEPIHDGDVFVGYRVLENDSDPRFAVGDIIVSVNGTPVEGTAAGGELLIAGLKNTQAPVGVRDVAAE